MAATPEARQRVLAYFGALSGWLQPAVKQLADDDEAVVAQAREVFEGLHDEMPYVEQPEHTMASSMFACAAMLAMFQVLRKRGVDAHAWGRAVHSLPAVAPPTGGDDDERSRRDADASQSSAAPNEFVFAMVDGTATSDGGMNITSCAICHLFGKHDAMELVPYMCAFDDVISDAAGQGLRRTGTIALGAKHCDFRFRPEGDPLRLVEQYPDRIRVDRS
jgi:hypothetical protein